MEMLNGLTRDEQEQRERYLDHCVRLSLRHRKLHILGMGVLGILGAFLAGWGLALALILGVVLLCVSMMVVAIRSRQRHAQD